MAITLNLTERQTAGMAELIALAQRGREDFETHATAGDYSAEDQTAAAARWKTAQDAIKAVETQKCCGPLNALEAMK